MELIVGNSKIWMGEVYSKFLTNFQLRYNGKSYALYSLNHVVFTYQTTTSDSLFLAETTINKRE